MRTNPSSARLSRRQPEFSVAPTDQRVSRSNQTRALRARSPFNGYDGFRHPG